MKVLIIIPSIENISGVDYHRLLIPHKQMEREYKDIEYYTADDLTIVPMDVLKAMEEYASQFKVSPTREKIRRSMIWMHDMMVNNSSAAKQDIISYNLDAIIDSYLDSIATELTEGKEEKVEILKSFAEKMSNMKPMDAEMA